MTCGNLEHIPSGLLEVTKARRFARSDRDNARTHEARDLPAFLVVEKTQGDGPNRDNLHQREHCEQQRAHGRGAFDVEPVGVENEHVREFTMELQVVPGELDHPGGYELG